VSVPATPEPGRTYRVTGDELMVQIGRTDDDAHRLVVGARVEVLAVGATGVVVHKCCPTRPFARAHLSLAEWAALAPELVIAPPFVGARVLLPEQPAVGRLVAVVDAVSHDGYAIVRLPGTDHRELRPVAELEVFS
jgi:hypothetical protein